MKNSSESTLDAASIARILEQHRLYRKTGGQEGCQANLSNADLRGVDLRGVDLRGANLHGANLRYADLRYASLGGAALKGANLRDASLVGADLRGADLRWASMGQVSLGGAEMSGADLDGADLGGAELDGADLSDADLRRASLFRGSLVGANLRDANLRCADLRFADLRKSCLNGAELKRAKMCGVLGLSIAADAPQRLLAVARAALAQESALDMETWHRCETTHCIAGWGIHLAGEKGQELESLYGPALAGRMLLGHEAAMHFHDHDIDARAWLLSVLDS